MATYVETKILQALLAHLDTLVLSPALPVAWPNVNYMPSGAYLRVNDIPTAADQVTLGTDGKNRLTGILQIDVMWVQGKGEISPKEVVGAIVAHFKRGTVLTEGGVNVRVIRPPKDAAARIDGAFYQIPVSISYQADAANPS